MASKDTYCKYLLVPVLIANMSSAPAIISTLCNRRSQKKRVRKERKSYQSGWYQSKAGVHAIKHDRNAIIMFLLVILYYIPLRQCTRFACLLHCRVVMARVTLALQQRQVALLGNLHYL